MDLWCLFFLSEVLNLSANPIAIAGPKLGKGETGVLRCAKWVVKMDT